ncbi:MAG: hypothetical protein KGV44_10915 [Flavobacteriaceae bacterium]|nr:hypothetical protein [Flavobacteriaceae bacterium]
MLQEVFFKNRPVDRVRFACAEQNKSSENDAIAFSFWEQYAKNVFWGGNGTVFFFNTERIPQYDAYVKENYDAINGKIQDLNRDFLYKPNPSFTLFDEKFLSYYYPFLDREQILDFQEKNGANLYANIDKKLFEYVGYQGNIKVGFLTFIDKELAIVGMKEGEEFSDFVRDYLSMLQVIKHRHYFPISRNSVQYCIITKQYIEIDDETKESIRIIKAQMDKLVHSGQLFYAAPILEEYCKTLQEETTFISPLLIDKEYRLFLPKYGKREIKMSHLTKAVYFFFLRHREGVFLEDLARYKEELLHLYQHISYRISLDQMRESIDNLINPQTRIVYQHLSRIRSAFVKQIDEQYAENYYVGGYKGAPKRIDLASELIQWECVI